MGRDATTTLPRTYKVIQWATGNVGKIALRHFAANPVFELVGVLVTNPAKVGKDAGELAGTRLTGIAATDDIEAIIALDADCVHFAPARQDIDLVCRLLRSGKNVISPLGPYYPTERFRSDCEKIEAACRDGGASFHGSGIHPGFAGDLLPLTLSRIMERIDHIHVYEVVDYLKNPSPWSAAMGFGRDPEYLLANPLRPPEVPYIFAQSMAMVVEALGATIDDLTTKIELATATKDIAYSGGVVPFGTVAGQHYEWTAWSGGAPVMTYHCFWVMGGDDFEPRWDHGETGYRVKFEGNPPMEILLRPTSDPAPGENTGMSWTTMAGVNTISQVCDAQPGLVTHVDLGVFGPRGVLRR